MQASPITQAPHQLQPLLHPSTPKMHSATLPPPSPVPTPPSARAPQTLPPPPHPHPSTDHASLSAAHYPPSPFWSPHQHPSHLPPPSPSSASSPQLSAPNPTGYQVVMTQSTHPNPRPRKPYTTTKVREMWSPSEHERMLEGLKLYKRDWAKVTRFVGTRSAAQVRSHAQKYFDKVARDKTDDFVPRPRPKRKSATPYPRKPREEAQQMAVAVPVPVPVSPSPVSVPIHHVLPVQHSLSHPGSPYIQPAASPSMFPPPPNSASPISFVSPAHFQHTPNLNTIPHTQMSSPLYNVFSPVTPFQQQASQQSPHFVSSQGYISSPSHCMPMIQTSPAQSHSSIPHVCNNESMYGIPSHPHPDGNADNCAKCQALKRYGTVLHELRSVGPTPALLGQKRKMTTSDGYPGRDVSHDARVNSETSTVETMENDKGSEKETEECRESIKKRKHRSDEHSGGERLVSAPNNKGEEEKDERKDKEEEEGERKKDKEAKSKAGNKRSKLNRGKEKNEERENEKGNGKRKVDKSSSHVESYSSTEQREIYDAVQSLQILSKRTAVETAVELEICSRSPSPSRPKT